MEDGWKHWPGDSSMPEELRGGSLVETKFRNGEVQQRLATNYRWEHCYEGDGGRSYDIVEYRVVEETPASEQSERDCAETPQEERKHNHYHKDVSKYDSIDVYRVLTLFEVTDQAIGHAAKKLLVAGGRGAKDINRDIQDVVDTLVRWQEMRKEDANG